MRKSKISWPERNRRNFKRWYHKHPKLHQQRNLHAQRMRTGWYDRLPLRIKKLKLELRAYRDGLIICKETTHYMRMDRGWYRNLPTQIALYSKILRKYRLGMLQ